MQNKPLNVIMAEILAKLDEKPPVEEGTLARLGDKAFDFFKGLGKGGSKAIPDPKIEPAGLAQGAENLVQAAVQDADTKLKLLRKHSPAEWVAAKAEGKTYDEFVFDKFPDTFAKLEKNPELKAKVATEFSKAVDEIMVAVERGEDPRALWPTESKMFDKDGRKSLAMSAMGHALIVVGLLVANKQSGSSSSASTSTSTSTIPADQVPWKTYLGMDPRRGDSLQKGNNPSRPWVIVSPAGVAVGKIDDPELVRQIEKLASMSPEDRKKLAQAEPKNFEVPFWSQDDLNKMSGAQQPTVKELPKEPSADKGAPPKPVPQKDADIVIPTKKKKSKEEEEAERKKREAAEKAKKAEEDKKRKTLPTITF